MIPLLLLSLTPVAEPAPWEKDETAYLSNIKQLTSDFVRAGEGYFSSDGTKIIYQAEEKDTGNPFYQIFLQDLKTGKYHRVSPGAGRTTCSYFRPDGKRVIFASSHEDPDVKKHQEAEYKQREDDKAKGIRRRYSWDFDPHVKIYESDLDGGNRKCLTPDAKVYTAEGSYSADGKQIVYSAGNAGNVQQDRLQLYVVNADGTGEKALTDNDKWVYWAPYWYKDGKHIIYTAADHTDEKARPNYDLYWMNIETGKTTRITHAPGADVLPVFNPDYTKVMWTSSRDGRSPTQLYIADFVAPKD